MKKILIPISALFVAGLSHAQTTNTENYVQTRVYLEPVTASSSTAKQVQTVQYLDGLGRPKQVVNVKASPQGKDVVSHIEYDGFGRQVKDYLPVPQSGTMNGGIVPNPLANATQPSLYGSEKIYSEKILENSPLDRVFEQKQVGNDWNSKPVKFEYDANISGEVIKYTTTTIWENGATKSTINYNGSYGSAQLYKNTIIDEDLNKTIEFKNGEGQTLLVRKVLDATNNADTYYVYNEYNQLAWVIPPLLSKMQTWGIAEQDALAYEYRYDGRNRLVEKKLPGKGWEFMVYDKADRLIMTQDANMRTENRWLFTKYDKFSRVVYTGITIDPGTRTNIQGYVDFAFPNNYEGSGSFTQNGLTVGYTSSNAFPPYIYQLLSVNYYDTYPAGSPTIPTQILGQNVLPQDAQNSNVSTKSLPVASYVKNIEDDNWTKNYTWYDQKGRAIGSHSINHLGGYTKTEAELDFAGITKQAITRHKRLDTDAEKIITENFTYDHQNRLLTHTHQVDNNPVEYLAQNKYNELSQLESKKVGGVSLGNGLQTVDYTYNIRGWMTKINDPANLGSDLFGYELKYQNPLTNFWTPRYNGNISEIDWKSSQDGVQRRYVYMYDSINRLTGGYYLEPNSSIVWTGYYNEYSRYDLNGNITQLTRMGKDDSQITPSIIDDLAYVYAGNQLTSVSDTSQNLSSYPVGGSTISYDLNGNMISHPDKAISSIIYNYLNLPSILIVGSGKKNTQTEYLYRADGIKLRKNYGGAAFISGQSTDYLDGFQYLTINDFNICIGCSAPLPILQFVPTSEGYFDFVKNKYIYNYSDHLGNVRLSYQSNGGSIEVLEENNYYPFGLKHQGYNALTGNPSYQYKYNGKELQETGMYDYGARFYMPDIGRWGVVDELAEKSTRFSTYTYALDNPIMFVDPDGREAERCCSWNDVKGFGRGLWSGTKGLATGLVQSNTASVMINAKKEWTKVYNAYEKGGAKAAGNQYVNSVYETSGAKALVQTAKGVAKGDMESIGSAVALGGAAILTHKIAGSKGTANMSELTNSVKSTAAEMHASKKAPAAVVGAELNGQTSIGVSGAPPSIVAPQLEGVVNELGGLGTRTASGNPVGCCAEFNAGNNLLLNNPSAIPSQINFTDAIRPRTGKVVPMCDNCKTTFGK